MQMVLLRKPFDCETFLDDKATVRWHRLVKRRNVHLRRASRQAIPPQPHRGGVSGHCPLALTGTARTMGALCPGLSGMHCGRHEGVVREPLIRSSSLAGVCRVGKPILWYFCLCDPNYRAKEGEVEREKNAKNLQIIKSSALTCSM